MENYLTTKVIKNPRSVVLFDEADKALNTYFYSEKKSLIDILLPIFEDGRLEDRIGQVADFSRCIVIIGSNGGINEVFDPRIGAFVPSDAIYIDITELMRAASNEEQELKYEQLKVRMAKQVGDYLLRKMRPEMLNRIDENIVLILCLPIA